MIYTSTQFMRLKQRRHMIHIQCGAKKYAPNIILQLSQQSFGIPSRKFTCARIVILNTLLNSKLLLRKLQNILENVYTFSPHPVLDCICCSRPMTRKRSHRSVRYHFPLAREMFVVYNVSVNHKSGSVKTDGHVVNCNVTIFTSCGAARRRRRELKARPSRC